MRTIKSNLFDKKMSPIKSVRSTSMEELINETLTIPIQKKME